MVNHFVGHTLPRALKEIDISAFANLGPRDLILNPGAMVADTLAAARALVYARSGDEPAYDAIGFRTYAASPRKGAAPLQTGAWSAMQRELLDQKKSDTVADEILSQQTKLRHRPLTLATESGDFRYEVDRGAIHLYRRRTDTRGREVEERWSFSLTDPPNFLLVGALDRDVRMIMTQQWQVELEATHWLPFPVLLKEGRFPRFQEIRSRLARETHPGAFYCFLSHRWLDPRHPDPDGLQARFAAWQLIAYLAEAVRVADQRGLHQPRRFSPQLGHAVGPRGSELAESLIVNVLRSSLDPDTVREAAAEGLPLERELEDYGVANAANDAGLEKLKRLLADCPLLRRLTEHIYLWYDYSCLPQPPRQGDEVELFRKGLEELAAAQIIGRTAIMLDDADDYLSRAWCTLEALVADTAGGATDLLVGSARPSAAEGYVEHHFQTLLEDRPHLVRRAILDTEVFGIQSPAMCMERLGLDATDAKDLPFIYKKLSSLGAPTNVHIDDSEIVTGVLPLPAFEEGTVAVRVRRSGRSFSPDAKPASTTSLDWTDALRLAQARQEDLEEATPPFFNVSGAGAGDAPTCHVAVVGASEGEAILLANWVRRNKTALASLFSVSIAGISWVATDIAPVGHMAVGTLAALPVTTDTWAVVATSARLQHCKVTGFITESLKWAGVPHALIAIDQAENNVQIRNRVETPEEIDISEQIVAVNLVENPPKTHSGGLFQWQIEEALL